MCTTIWLTVPPEVRPTPDVTPLSDALERFTGDSARLVGRYGNDLLFSVDASGGRCQCGTALGSARRPDEQDERALNRKVDKLRQRGWSEARIGRWLDERGKTHAKEERIYHVRAEGPDAPGVDHWVLLLRHLVLAARLDRVGLNVSWGEPDWSEVTEKFVHVDELEPKLLRSLEHDTLYVTCSPPKLTVQAAMFCRSSQVSLSS
jgi:hypothetical protein